MGVVTSHHTLPSLKTALDNPVYSPCEVASVMEDKCTTVPVASDYERPVEYEMITDCKDEGQTSIYASVGPEPVYHDV